ncbi:unnamed protein product [Lasius platythorax]|uniref:Uncharacterized protein n=1 Tax=Lasius platythorax TaxID=488582 RepID=A0AAV2NNH7_9HYME
MSSCRLVAADNTLRILSAERRDALLASGGLRDDTAKEEYDEIRKRGESDRGGLGEKERRADATRGMNKERELRPKLGCNYSRLPCKLSSCHSYLLCRVQLR